MGVGGVERDMVLGDGVPFVIQGAVVGKAVVVASRGACAPGSGGSWISMHMGGPCRRRRCAPCSCAGRCHRHHTYRGGRAENVAVEVAVAEGILVERVVAEGMVVLKDCVALAQDAFDSTGVSMLTKQGGRMAQAR